MPLIETPGSATADTYATLVEANAWNAIYVSMHSTDPWATAVDATKENALRWAAKFLDAYYRAWSGSAVDGVQALGWPRSGMLSRNGFAVPTSGASSIPADLKNAQSEYARQLLSADKTADNAVINQGLTSLGAGSVSLGWADQSQENSLLVTRSVKELNALAAMWPDAVKALIPSGWLKLDPEDPSVRRSLIFEVL